MIRFLINVAIFFGSALLALWVTDLLLADFTVGYPQGIIVAAIIFALLQAILAPLVFNIARKYASAVLGGVGLISTFIALWLTTVITGDEGLNISTAAAWLLGTLLVWLITALGGWILGAIFLKNRVKN